MDIVRALKFPFDDHDWPSKLGLGTLLMLVGMVLPFIPLGYQVQVARNVIHGKQHPVPGTNDLGQVITDGIMALAAVILYALPLTPFLCLLMFTGALTDGSDAGGFMFCVVFCCLFVPTLIYGILATAFYWIGVIRYAATGNFSSFLQIRAIWGDIRNHLDILGMLLLYSIGIGIVLGMISPFALVTIIGLPLILLFNQLATGHLIGQAALEMERGL
jgi:hypothetical protein